MVSRVSIPSSTYFTLASFQFFFLVINVTVTLLDVNLHIKLPVGIIVMILSILVIVTKPCNKGLAKDGKISIEPDSKSSKND